MKVPYQRLSPRALRGVIEEFVTREGTPYGLREHTLEEKVQHVMAQLEREEVAIFYDDETQTVDLRCVDKARGSS